MSAAFVPTFSSLTSIDEAVDIVRAAERPNVGILIDMIYYEFNEMVPEELSRI